MGMTRRDFVMRMGAAGGYGAALASLQALGLLTPAATTATGRFDLPAGSGHGKRVLILGAGIAGLVSAWELGKAGYHCEVLEARERVGGRNWTIRRGTALEMIDGTKQQCAFDDGYYFNAGPARLPSTHTTMLGYCREFGVELEVEVNMSRSARLYDPDANGGNAVQMRQVAFDTRGRICELLGKSINKGALDGEFTAADKEAFVQFLRQYADLDPDLVYKGSSRAGYKIMPGAGEQAGVLADPLDLHTLMDPLFLLGQTFDEIFEMQATMFQPVGGMDHIPKAFEKRVGHRVRRGAEVIEIVNGADGVKVAYRHKGRVEWEKADYCICTLPLPVLAGVKANFSPDFAKAIANTPYDHANKVAWQSPRFWETGYNIYGGLGFARGETNLVWYPSGGFFRPTGILIGCYNFGDDARHFMERPLPERFSISRDAIEHLHPGHGHLLDRPITIAWNKVPYNLGPWVDWKEPNSADYKLLSEPDGRVYLAGEHLSHINGWQEGAALSAQRVLNLIAARATAGASV